MASQNINPTATYIKPDKKSINVLVYAAAYVSVIIIFHKLYRFSSGYNERISAWIQLFSYCVFGVTGIILFKDLLKRGIRECSLDCRRIYSRKTVRYNIVYPGDDTISGPLFNKSEQC